MPSRGTGSRGRPFERAGRVPQGMAGGWRLPSRPRLVAFSAVRTLGIDLSSDPKKTAACSISWNGGRAQVEGLRLGLNDDSLVESMLTSDWVGIDAPFGWPAEFIEAVTTWSESGRWPETRRDKLRFRTTDLVVKDKARMPLSVSTDRIAVTAMRCARLLTDYAERKSGAGAQVERRGDDHVVEVYPAAALVLWSDEARHLRFDPQGYKGADLEARDKRERLMSALEGAAPWLYLDHATRRLCIEKDDALDSVLCSLVARAAAQGQTLRPETVEQTAAATIEGWIHLPTDGGLDTLSP
jgi:predicted nuclease with RNAse H fold